MRSRIGIIDRKIKLFETILIKQTVDHKFVNLFSVNLGREKASGIESVVNCEIVH